MNPSWNQFSRQMRGFTLVELLVVVSIMGVLLAIGVPSYNDYVRKSNRKAAISQIQTLSSRLERARSTLLSYSSFAGYQSSEFTHYTYTIDVPDGGTTFTISATPNATSSQVNDPCGIISYDNTNTWSFSGVMGDDAESRCLVR